MFNFKNIATAAIIATASLCTLDAVSALGAKADQCTKIAGYDVCYRDNGDYGADRIGVWAGNRNVADITVICTGGGGNRWELLAIVSTSATATSRLWPTAGAATTDSITRC